MLEAIMRSRLIFAFPICFGLVFQAQTLLAGTPVERVPVSPKAVLPPIVTPEDNPWRLSAGLMWRQMDGLSIHQNIETDSGRFFADLSSDLEGWGPFVMLESPALFRRGPSALHLSLMYSWAGMNDVTLRREFPGRTVWQDFSLNLHTLSMGPRWVFEVPRVRFSTGAGLALNWARWEAVTRMTSIPPGNILTTATRGNAEPLPGFYWDVAAQVRLTPRWSLLVMGRYDWANSFQTQHQFFNSAVNFRSSINGWSVLTGLTFRF